MPLTPGASRAAISQNIRELHTGKTYAHTAGKFGKERANKQAVAIALNEARKSHNSGGPVRRYDSGGTVNPVQQVISALQQGSSMSGLGASGVAAQTSPTTTSSGVSPSTSTTTSTPTTTSTASTTPSTNVSAIAPAQQVQQLNEGGIANRAVGGFNMEKSPSLNSPWFERQEVRNLHWGPVLSNVPGRTDAHQVKVPGGSYVLPAAHLSSMGNGNSLSGMSIASRMFGGPYGTSAPRIGGYGTMPRPPKMMGLSDGGYAGGVPTQSGDGESIVGPNGKRYSLTPVDISGGEFTIPPWAIEKKFGSLKRGHAILDHWVMEARKKEIKTLKNLPPPAKN